MIKILHPLQSLDCVLFTPMLETSSLLVSFIFRAWQLFLNDILTANDLGFGWIEGCTGLGKILFLIMYIINSMQGDSGTN